MEPTPSNGPPLPPPFPPPFPPAVLWASWNVGATKPEEPGCYYAWGETEEQTGENAYTKPSYKYFTTDNAATYVNKYLTEATHTHLGIGTLDNLVVLEDADDVARKEWDGGWRMPLKSDIKDLFDKTSALDDYEYNGVKGVIFLGKNEYKDRCIFIFASSFVPRACGRPSAAEAVYMIPHEPPCVKCHLRLY